VLLPTPRLMGALLLPPSLRADLARSRALGGDDTVVPAAAAPPSDAGTRAVCNLSCQQLLLASLICNVGENVRVLELPKPPMDPLPQVWAYVCVRERESALELPKPPMDPLLQIWVCVYVHVYACGIACVRAGAAQASN